MDITVNKINNPLYFKARRKKYKEYVFEYPKDEIEGIVKEILTRPVYVTTRTSRKYWPEIYRTAGFAYISAMTFWGEDVVREEMARLRNERMSIKKNKDIK